MAGNEPSFFSNIAPAVKNLAIINVLVWLFVLANEKTHIIGVDVFNVFSLHYWETDSFKPFQLVSYMFLHDRFSFSHVFFNMFAVWMFGGIMEHTWGSRRFLFFYIACGLGAGLIQEGVQYIDWAIRLSAYNIMRKVRKVRKIRLLFPRIPPQHLHNMPITWYAVYRHIIYS